MGSSLFLKQICWSGILAVCLWGMACQSPASTPPPHVFLIMVDDLRPELGCYGNPYVHAPNLDALAEDALVFENAYANVPVCGASRASLLSGMRPTRSRFLSYSSTVEGDAPEALTLPAFLRSQGFLSLSMGKIFHNQQDKAGDWSLPPYRSPKHTNKDYASQANIDAAALHPRTRATSFEVIDTTDEAYADGKLAQYAIEKLAWGSTLDTSLFMAIGFWKPHLPWNAPQKYWDLYERESLPFPSHYFAPEGAPAASLHNFGELRSYTDIPDDSLPLDSEIVRKNIHGYYACISYTDAQIGKFIQALKAKGLYDNSVIILVGDHGWFLGEHGLWAKHANYRDALRTSLMIKFPHSEKTGSTQLPVELIELYPTLAEILDIPPPLHLQSQSFLSQLDVEEALEEKEVYCRFKEGETVIKGIYAYTEYLDDEAQVYARMLYDHSQDLGENTNLVEEADSTLVQSLSQKLTAYRTKYGK